MKIRIKFQKFGSMKFVGHLDVMRYFQKMCRRANMDSEYTKGFSPHQIMSFAAPLGVGLTSDGEYVDVQLFSSDSPEEMINRMNATMTEGFRIIDFHPLQEREEHTKNVTAMSLVSSADYLVSLKTGYQLSESILSLEDFAKAFTEYIHLSEIVIDKKTKTSEKEVDIKPMITLVAFHEAEYEAKRRETLTGTLKALAEHNNNNTKPESVADIYESGIKVFLQLNTGSAANLKPELVMEAFYEYLGLPFDKLAWQVHRLEVYTKDPETGKLSGLDQVER